MPATAPTSTDADHRTPTRPAGLGAVRPEGYRYDRTPMLVYWETTQACGLACRHCRASAQPARSPLELTTAECETVLDQILDFGRPLPHIVFTGGDPLRRADLEHLVAAATARGIGASLAPAVTEDLTRDRLAALRDAGIQTMSLSLDGSDPQRHDGLRGVPGTFDMTMRAVATARGLGIPVQINTLVTDSTVDDLPAVRDVVADLDILRWSLFFLISVGRGAVLREVTPGRAERLMHWLYDVTRTSPFQVKTTEACHYRRVAVRRMEAEGLTADEIARTPVARGFGIRDGNGIMFVGHDGRVYPSGFLPLPVGDVRTESIVTIYREQETFRALRDTTQLRGRCGRCPYADRCGGSRARAYAWTGDPLESDPLCPFVPRAR